MNTRLRNYVASAFLLGPVLVPLLVAPSVAMAQTAAPDVDSLDVSSDGGTEPGSRLALTLTGTPGARAVVRIHGVREPILLRETERGVYRGRYTIKRTDRVEDDSEVRAMLRVGKRSGSASYELSDLLPAGRTAAVVAPVQPARPPEPLRIERFGVAPPDRLEPGAELRFALEGPPGATVVVDLPGVDSDVRLREMRPGHYEGGYTIRRADVFNAGRPVVATLRLGERVVTASVAFPPAATASADNRPPAVVNLQPREGDTVSAGRLTQISASFDDRGGSGVDPASVRIFLSGRNVTSDARIEPGSFIVREALPPGRHTVDVTARDNAGNLVRRSWSFDVGAAAPAQVPLQIFSHGNNGQVDGATTVRGRTAPFAQVTMKVDSVAPVAGLFNLSQELPAQSAQADADGNFAFTFSPGLPIPGTRYEISIASTSGGVTSEAKLTLHQRQG
jgi:hypothetical protein